jgi:hypothetical protein
MVFDPALSVQLEVPPGGRAEARPESNCSLPAVFLPPTRVRALSRNGGPRSSDPLTSRQTMRISQAVASYMLRLKTKGNKK